MGRAAIAACLSLAALAAACGGSGGGGDDGDPLQGKSKSLAGTFDADAPNPGPGSSALALEAASGDTVGLRLAVAGASDVHSASLDLVFDPDVAEFVDWSVGDLLESSGAKPFYLVSEQPGRIVVGVSLAGTGSGVDVGSPLTLIRLTFQLTAAGSSDLAFENMALLDSHSTPQEIPGITWYGGTLSAN